LQKKTLDGNKTLKITIWTESTRGKHGWVINSTLISHAWWIVRPLRSDGLDLVTPRPVPGSAVLTPGSSLGSYIVPTDQHGSFVHTLSSLMRTRENFRVGHPSQIAPSQARLTWRFFRDRLPKKKMHLVGMNTILILLSLGLGYHRPLADNPLIYQGWSTNDQRH
jgi:hypothetical protein